MFKNYLKIAFRNTKKQKTYSFINIFGLAVGLTVFVLISLYIQYELSFDKFYKNSDRIYRLVIENLSKGSGTTELHIPWVPNVLGPAMIENFPEVISTARIFRWSNPKQYFTDGEIGIYENLYYSESGFFEVFSIPFIWGNPETALNETRSLVLSENLSEKYFGNENPVGKLLTLIERSGKNSYKITGVFANMKENSHLKMDLITSIEPIWQETSSAQTYILLQKGTNPNDFEKKLQNLLNNQLPSGNNDFTNSRCYLQPLTAIHLHSSSIKNASYHNINDIRNIYIYASIAFSILIIVCLNYMNHSLVRSFQRFKEISIRKVAGADRKELLRQFLSESFFITIISLVVSLVFTVLFLPGYSNIIGINLTLSQIQDPVFFLVLASVVVFVGLLGGSFPVFYLSSLRIVQTLKGVLNGNSKGSWARNTLIIAQFSTAIITIIGSLIISSQMHFIKTKDMGYDREQIVVLSNMKYHTEIRSNEETIKAELLKNPNIKTVSRSDHLPNFIHPRGNVELVFYNTGKPIPFNVFTVDYDFVDLYGIKILEGRNFLKEFQSESTRDVLINETAASILGVESPIGREFKFWGGIPGKIVGIVKDFHSQSLHHKVPPTFIVLLPNFTDHFSIKISSANIPETIKYIKNNIKIFAPNYHFDYYFFNEIFESDYNKERKMEQIFSLLMLFSVGLACSGLVGIAIYSAQLRVKEIGIRKVLGATVPGIVTLLSKDFTKCILFANILAWPTAYYFINKWLQDFAYRIDLTPWIFVLSGLSALGLALLTISYISIKSARANPVDSLRTE